MLTLQWRCIEDSLFKDQGITPRCSQDMNTGAEEATVLEAFTRRQLVKLQQTEKI
jgi:hypothetical protein